MGTLLFDTKKYCGLFVNPDGTVREVEELGDENHNLISEERLVILKEWYKSLFENDVLKEFMKFYFRSDLVLDKAGEQFFVGETIEYAHFTADRIHRVTYEKFNKKFGKCNFVNEIMTGRELSLTEDELYSGIYYFRRKSGALLNNNVMYSKKLCFKPKKLVFSRELDDISFEEMIEYLYMLSLDNQKKVADIFDKKYAGYFNYLTINKDDLSEEELVRLKRIEKAIGIRV